MSPGKTSLVKGIAFPNSYGGVQLAPAKESASFAKSQHSPFPTFLPTLFSQKKIIFLLTEKTSTTNGIVDNKANTSVSGSFKYYTVQKGDSLYKIAQKNKTTVAEIMRLNNFGAKYSLLPGKKIKVGTI